MSRAELALELSRGLSMVVTMTDIATDETFELPASVTIEYPGSFRPVPGFAIEVPPLWIVGEFPGALFMLGTQARDDGGYGNVIVKHNRVSPDMTIVELATANFAELLENCPEVVLLEEMFVNLQVKHYVRRTIIPAENKADIVLRSDSFVQIREQGSRTDDILHFCWLCPYDFHEEFELEFGKILASFKFI
jgi:hypothetical protein